MAESGGARARRRGSPGRLRAPRAWCCSFAAIPNSPDSRAAAGSRKLPPKSPASFHSSPSSKLVGLGIIDPRRILSPGRVSPIDPDPPLVPLPELTAAAASRVAASAAESPDLEQKVGSLVPFVEQKEIRVCEKGRDLDLRLYLRGRDGRSVVLELDSGVLCESSAFFAAMVPDLTKNADRGGGGKRIEVDGVENVDAFREAVELMYEKDASRWLVRAGVSRAIDVLEVSSSIMFDRGIRSCLNYIEAVPWSETEEDKLKTLFTRCTFDEVISQAVLARLRPQGWSSSEDLAVRLIHSVTNGANNGARKEMQSLVNSLLSKSSVYQKDLAGLNKESLYQICYSCLNSLVELFKEASEFLPTDQPDQALTVRETKPMIERVSKQAENLTWLLEILINNQMAEEFVDLWAKQDGLIGMHERASPMVRYELSRISASVFIALGKGKLQCRGDLRSRLFCCWFGPMLMDFGWLQRCSKGLDVRMLEETLGQALLTLPLKQQQSLFEEWFRCFAARGTECPNLSRAFQVWWRRSFVRSSEACR